MQTFISNVLMRPQQFVDRIGMYRLVTGALVLLAAISVLSGFRGWLAYSGVEQLIALGSALAVALLLNITFARLWHVNANHESAVITALILFFLFIPGTTLLENQALWLAVVIGIASKFLLTYRRQHIFNAAAVGAFAVSCTGLFPATWWVGNPTLFWPVLFLGVLVVLKLRRWTPVVWFLGVGFTVFLVEAMRAGDAIVMAVELYLFSWPTIFLAFFMLTEPFTMPPTRRTQAVYGGLVGGLANTTFFMPFFPMTPELALLIGNLAVYPFRIRQKLFLKLKEKREIAQNTYELVFGKPEGLRFSAGQYLEWMLPHRPVDDRGIRRYFTIAAAPTEPDLRLAFKLTSPASSYKRALVELAEGEVLIASQLAGDFVLPDQPTVKLGFIAGGIGVTPFRSHIQYMIDTEQTYDTKLLYCCNVAAELAYADTFAAAAEQMPLEVIPVIAHGAVDQPAETGYVTPELLTRRVPDFRERTWYLSGPPPMVAAYGKLLREMGVSRRQIRKDFFPGLA